MRGFLFLVPIGFVVDAVGGSLVGNHAVLAGDLLVLAALLPVTYRTRRVLLVVCQATWFLTMFAAGVYFRESILGRHVRTYVLVSPAVLVWMISLNSVRRYGSMGSTSDGAGAFRKAR